jgi:PAS domain-containing protein
VIDRREWLQITLSCVGDGVIAVDQDGRVNYLNPVAENLTGWTFADAAGEALEKVFRIVHETTGEPVQQPVRKVIELGMTVASEDNPVHLPAGAAPVILESPGFPIGLAEDAYGAVRPTGGR